MFLKQSVVLVAIALLILEAHASTFKLTKIGGDSKDHDHDVDNDSSFSQVALPDLGKAVAAGTEVCQCAKYKEFFSKFAILFQAYSSKELIPDLQAMGSKLVDFVLRYLAKEKPNEMNKFHGFIESTAKVTGSVVTEINGGKA